MNPLRKRAFTYQFLILFISSKMAGQVEVIDLDQPVTQAEQFPVSWIYGLLVVILLLLIIILVVNRRKKKLEKSLKSTEKNTQFQQKIIDDLKKQIIQLRNDLLKREKQPDFFDKTTNSIVITDTSGEILSMNNGFTKLSGMSKDEFTEKYGSNYKNYSGYPKAIDEAIKSKSNVSFPSMRMNTNGEEIWINTEVCPILDDNHQIQKLYFFESDVNLFKTIESEIQQQRDEIELEKTKAVLQRDKMIAKFKGFSDSINYAMRIQKALLPSEGLLQQSFSDFFVLYKPRDVVSGDFYWTAKKGNRQIIVAADCTGHGVPGAFMSILGINFLNEIITKQKQVSAATILDQLRALVIDALDITEDANSAQDGIDIGVLLIDSTKDKLQYSGANQNMYLIRNQNLEIIRGDRMPVGKHPNMKQPFSNKNIDFQDGDAIYLFTDGYVDQFGWRNGKKFKSRQLQEQLLQIQSIPMKGQKVILENTINNWQGDLEQVDDMLLIGIKLTSNGKEKD